MLDILLSILPYIFFSGQQQLLIRKKITTKYIVISYGIYHSQSTSASMQTAGIVKFKP